MYNRNQKNMQIRNYTIIIMIKMYHKESIPQYCWKTKNRPSIFGILKYFANSKFKFYRKRASLVMISHFTFMKCSHFWSRIIKKHINAILLQYLLNDNRKRLKIMKFSSKYSAYERLKRSERPMVSRSLFIKLQLLHSSEVNY